MKTKKTVIRPPNKKQQANSLKLLHKKTWNIFSKVIRKAKANFRGYTKCYTCQKLFPWQEMHAGHWQHGRCDFEIWNIHPQCVSCNRYKRGKLDVYTINLTDEYGPEMVKKLRQMANTHPGYTYSELKELHSKYLKLYESL